MMNCHAVLEINAKTLYPIHTEYPELCQKISNGMILVEEDKKYDLTS